MKRGVIALIGFSAIVALAAPTLAAQAKLAMLDRLDRGNWEMRIREQAGEPQQICLQNGRKLIQLRHPSSKCDKVVVDDGEAEVTVQYTCPGHGYGRTSIRKESNRLVQINSQGIVDGLPFAFVAEARRVGDCSN